MTQCKIIGLTGGIATGKSTVSNIIKKYFTVIDADKIAKNIVEPNMKGYNKVIEYFGENILLPNKDIDREKLGNIIFNSKRERIKLNEILHPIIISTIKKELEDKKDEKYIFLDIPLLFETIESLKENGIYFYEIWLVYSNRDIQIQRLIKRDNIDMSLAIKKIDSQMSLEEKKSISDKIIYNNEGLEELNIKVNNLLLKLNIGG